MIAVALQTAGAIPAWGWALVIISVSVAFVCAIGAVVKRLEELIADG